METSLAESQRTVTFPQSGQSQIWFGVWSGSALFASYPFRVLESSMGSMHWFKIEKKNSRWQHKSLNAIDLKLRIVSSRSHAFVDPLKPHFYIVKLGFTGVYIIFLISAQKHRLWVLVRTISLRRFWRVHTIYVLSRIWKISDFLSKQIHFLVVKFSIYLNRRAFVMTVGNLENDLNTERRKNRT